jgi:1-acyl-sn-glycerol-3-phosphate acyltransferase
VSDAATNHPRAEDRISVRLLQAFDVCFSRIYHQVIVRAPCSLPRTGAAIVVSNHISGLDPLLIQSVCPRLITWMMAEEYYEIRALRWIFKAIDAIPVDRTGRDPGATRAALRALKDGRILGIFPEGKIEDSHELLPFQHGVVRLADKLGVPVYPTYIDGTQRGKEMLPAFLERNRAAVAFGPRMDVRNVGSADASIEAATARVRDAVASLRDQYFRNQGKLAPVRVR